MFRVDDSQLLASNGNLSHATAMSVFAIEELVKYRYLKDERTKADAARVAILKADGRIFGHGRRSHEFKINLAKQWKLIPDDAWEIHKGYWNSKYWGRPWWDTERVLDPKLRLESIFVDYDQELHVWINAPLVDAEKLRYANEPILKALKANQ